MVETRSQERGAPLKKPGAYNTDAYYQEKDEGFGDVGVNQEPDAGALDNPNDPEYTPTGAEVKMAEEDAARADEEVAGGASPSDMRAEAEDLTKPSAVGEPETDRSGEPVPVVEELAAGEADITPEEGRDTV